MTNKDVVCKVVEINEWWCKLDLPSPRPWGLPEYTDWLSLPTGMLPRGTGVGCYVVVSINPMGIW